MPGIKQTLYTFNNTLFGRMSIGPAVSVIRFWSAEFVDILKGDVDKAKDWAVFAVSAAVSLFYIVGIAGMPFWQYLLLIAYPGVSLALVRSFSNTRAAGEFRAPHHHRRGFAVLVAAVPVQQSACGASHQAGAHLVQNPRLLPGREGELHGTERRLCDAGLRRNLRALFLPVPSRCRIRTWSG